MLCENYSEAFHNLFFVKSCLIIISIYNLFEAYCNISTVKKLTLISNIQIYSLLWVVPNTLSMLSLFCVKCFQVVDSFTYIEEIEVEKNTFLKLLLKSYYKGNQKLFKRFNVSFNMKNKIHKS